MSERDTFIYTIYLFSEPIFLLLENSSIIDIDLSEVLGDKKAKNIKIFYNDPFFDFNLKLSKMDSFSVTIQTYQVDVNKDKFISQTDLNGDEIKIGEIDGKNFFSLNFSQITNNNAWPSISPKFEQASKTYNQIKLSYLRNKKLESILS